ncbi:Hypothetical predicted protein, partial [Olea europaea subsp. europaea]
ERQQVPCPISISGSGQSDLHLGQVRLHLRLINPALSPAVAVQSPPSTGPATSPVVGAETAGGVETASADGNRRLVLWEGFGCNGL